MLRSTEKRGSASLRLISVLLFACSHLLAETLETQELQELRRYLASLEAHSPGVAVKVDDLAEVPFSGLAEVIRSYVETEDPDDSTHLAFQNLLERMSRTALAPWDMLQLYSPEFARFLSVSGDENSLAQKLHDKLIKSGLKLQPFDLAVRLAPEASLKHLAFGHKEGRIESFEAWGRRLARAPDRRPIPNLDSLLRQIAESFSFDLPQEELQTHLEFIAAWPALQATYHHWLARCLQSDDPSLCKVGLRVQERRPAMLELNEAIVSRFPDAPEILESAIRNYGFDTSNDYSETLRRVWAKLKPSQLKARYACLFAMGVHPKGNDSLALEAVKERPYDFIDVAAVIMAAGDAGIARQAVRHVLEHSEHGHEESLRLAREMNLTGFSEEAVRIIETSREQILRQTALRYLQLADGKTRRKLLSYLTHPNEDIRLATIQMFSLKSGLTAEDMEEIGPALIRVATTDSSTGHRQEAVFALAQWREPLAEPFFRKLLDENPPVKLASSYYNDALYWRYRFRLVALLGLAELSGRPAGVELLLIHGQGGETERMDVLLCFTELREVPDAAFLDLRSSEPKLVATAARLIQLHGTEEHRQRLRLFFESSPLWLEFLDSGIDDHNILHYAGLKPEAGVMRNP